MTRAFLAIVAALASGACSAPAAGKRSAAEASRIDGVVASAGGATASQLAAWTRQGRDAVALELTAANRAQVVEAARRVEAAGLALYYWIEVGRSPQIADAHPEWMCSLQGHDEWRRHHPEAPLPGEGEVIKTYPWVPVLYKEGFDAQLERVGGLLEGLPRPAGVLLNDLQGGPSACGCGNTLCRWTTDYGPLTTATRLPATAAADFVAAVRRLLPGSRVIPVWTTECEEDDARADGACAGVGCFRGLCWKEYTRQLVPVGGEVETLAVLLPYRAFGRDDPSYGPMAGWIGAALESFRTLPPAHGGEAIEPGRLVAVLQGWDVSEQEVAAQVARAMEAGSAGHFVSLVKIEQSFEPRLWKVRATAH